MEMYTSDDHWSTVSLILWPEVFFILIFGVNKIIISISKEDALISLLIS